MVRSVNSKSFIFGSDFVCFRQEKTNSNPNVKLLPLTEQTLVFLKRYYPTSPSPFLKQRFFGSKGTTFWKLVL